MSNISVIIKDDTPGENSTGSDTTKPEESPTVSEPEHITTTTPNTGIFTNFTNNTGTTSFQIGIGIVTFILFDLIIFSFARHIRKKHYHSMTYHYTDIDLQPRKFEIITISLFSLVLSIGATRIITDTFRADKTTATDLLPLAAEDVTIEIERTDNYDSFGTSVPIPIVINSETTAGYKLYAYAPGKTNKLINTSDPRNVIWPSDIQDYSNNRQNIWGVMNPSQGGERKIVPAFTGVNPTIEDAVILHDIGTATTKGDEPTVYIYIDIDEEIPSGTYSGNIEFFEIANESASGNSDNTDDDIDNTGTEDPVTDCEANTICYHSNTTSNPAIIGSKSTATGNKEELFAHNLVNPGYGFAGWNTAEDMILRAVMRQVTYVPKDGIFQAALHPEITLRLRKRLAQPISIRQALAL